MVNTPPRPPPREDNMMWKFDALSYVVTNFPSGVEALRRRWADLSDDTLDQYIKACYTAQSEAQLLACESLLHGSDAPQPSLGKSNALQSFSKEREYFLKAFSHEYKDNRSCVKTFTEFVDSCAAGWDPTKYLAPYTSLVQSSGTGKSRLLKEFANDRYVIYCCVRTKGSSGIPARSWIADKLVPAPGSNKERRWNCSILYASFICACIDHLADSVNTKITPKEWCEKQLMEESGGPNVSGVAFWTEIYKRMTEFQTKFLKKHESGDEKVMKLLYSEIEQSCANVVKKCEASNVVTKGRALLTFAMDEARSLLEICGDSTHFNIFRWIASHLKKGCGIFIVLLDTASKISNFQPATIPDGSYRYSSAGRKLLPPFYTVDTFNILAPEGRIWNDIRDSASDLTSELTSHFKKGRPLFGSYIQSCSCFEVESVVSLAVSKLLGGVPPSSFEDIKVDHNIAVALLSVRAAVFVKPQSELASSLVASHLAMCLAISSDRRAVFTGYPSEPVLAEAACHIMNRGSKLDLGEILDPVLPYIREGIVEGGARGELVARLLFLLAWDHACIANASEYTPGFAICGVSQVLYTRPLTVRKFLNSLADEHRLDAALKGQIDEQEMERFLKGRVLFTHFSAVTYSVKRHELIDFYESSAAVMCKRGEEAIDLIIPVWLSPSEMSYILVQVRNYSGADPKYKWASSDVTPESAGLEERQVDYPFLVLYFSLGYKEPKVFNLKYEKHQDADPSTIPRAKEPTEEQKTARKRARSSEESFEDPFQMIIGLFSLQPAIYPFLRDEKNRDYGDGDKSNSSRHLSGLCRAWTDPLNYVENNKIGGLGEDSAIREAKCSFVKETCVLTYNPRVTRV